MAESKVPQVVLPTGTTHLTYTMAALTFVGGLAAYTKAKSTQSLVAGVVFAGIFGYSGFQIQSGNETKGFRLGLIGSAGLAAVMGQRFYRTRKPMPAGALAGLGLLSSAYHWHKYSQWAELE